MKPYNSPDLQGIGLVVVGCAAVLLLLDEPDGGDGGRVVVEGRHEAVVRGGVEHVHQPIAGG